ncbi:hypothetical protein [Mycolicibacterium sp.]|uniref:hypothetical protein n=1 Tax=Mycolicibacterium sp. TaxID=2320850 RepID=UPI00355D3913
MRKQTVFDLCDTHAALGGGRRSAEMACEGGPAYGGPCSPRPCRILPGSDFYSQDCTDEEFVGLVANWAVNR